MNNPAPPPLNADQYAYLLTEGEVALDTATNAVVDVRVWFTNETARPLANDSEPVLTIRVEALRESMSRLMDARRGMEKSLKHTALAILAISCEALTGNPIGDRLKPFDDINQRLLGMSTHLTALLDELVAYSTQLLFALAQYTTVKDATRHHE